METTRQNKISRLLQKELSEIFLLQTKAMPGILISVSAVRISPDMSIARVYLSVFPSEKAEEMVKNINENMKSIRFELGTRVRHQLRIIPELKFFVDDSLDYIEKIDSLLKLIFPSTYLGVIFSRKRSIMLSILFPAYQYAGWHLLRWHWSARFPYSTDFRIW